MRVQPPKPVLTITELGTILGRFSCSVDTQDGMLPSLLPRVSTVIQNQDGMLPFQRTWETEGETNGEQSSLSVQKKEQRKEIDQKKNRSAAFYLLKYKH